MPLRSHVVRTPLLRHRSEDPALAGKLHLKPETLQPFGSYKIRGVAAVVAAADPAEVAKGLNAVSAGNMGQSVAFAARSLGVPCRVFVPDTTPEMKKAVIRSLGAELIEMPFADIWAAVQGRRELAAEGVFVHPTRTPALLDGYAGLGEEIVADLPEVDAVVVPIGLGGLAMGVSAAIKRLAPRAAVYTVEPDTAGAMAAAWTAGRPVEVERKPSFVDAIGTPEVNPAVFDVLKTRLSGALTVTLDAAEAALVDLFRVQRIVAEGAAACALAAGKALAAEGRHQHIACILTGANIDEEKLLAILGRR